MDDKAKAVIRETDGEAIALARRLIRTARHGAIGVIDAEGAPLCSRVGVATDTDGAPVILVSMLAGHTRALVRDQRCSLLLGEPGKGDPLAHPRISIACRARRLDNGSEEWTRARRRYLLRNPKAKLYVDLGDFMLFRLEPTGASLNGGFGKAYVLTVADLLLDAGAASALAQAEAGAVEHMNADHADAIDLYARHFGGVATGGWQLTGIDPEGLDLGNGDGVLRILFPMPVTSADGLRPMLVQMARAARAALEGTMDSPPDSRLIPDGCDGILPPESNRPVLGAALFRIAPPPMLSGLCVLGTRCFQID